MNDQQSSSQQSAVDDLYAESHHWDLNTGEETIHAKRIGGKWRIIRWMTASVWLIFFFGPYLQWGDRQAVFPIDSFIY